jgi:hypothetical protein
MFCTKRLLYITLFVLFGPQNKKCPTKEQLSRRANVVWAFLPS